MKMFYFFFLYVTFLSNLNQFSLRLIATLEIRYFAVQYSLKKKKKGFIYPLLSCKGPWICIFSQKECWDGDLKSACFCLCDSSTSPNANIYIIKLMHRHSLHLISPSPRLHRCVGSAVWDVRVPTSASVVFGAGGAVTHFDIERRAVFFFHVHSFKGSVPTLQRGF